MSTSFIYTLILIGLLFIAFLTRLILKQTGAERERKAEQLAREEKYAQESAEQRKYLVDSIKILSNAVLHDDKITLTEGCIRLKVMMDNLDPSMHQHPELSVIEEVYNRTSHIPFLSDWRKLDRKVQRSFEKEMREVEQECKERINKAAKSLVSFPLIKAH